MLSWFEGDFGGQKLRDKLIIARRSPVLAPFLAHSFRLLLKSPFGGGSLLALGHLHLQLLPKVAL